MNILLNGIKIEVVSAINTIIVGSGAAALNAANRLYDFGEKNIAIVTDNIYNGTSRNSGSDKQTYYKLTLAGDNSDSIYDMAKSLYNGGATDGDIALCEAALSTRSFYNLVELGVPFPQNETGEFVGYKTDHDPKQRATSAGPLTSKIMTEKLQEQIENKNIPIYNNHMVIKIITKDGDCVGVLCLDTKNMDNENKRYKFFSAKNTIYATGGPARLYSNSVYPTGQSSAHGVAFESGIKGKNLTEWQYGIASIKYRWNISGAYQQVLPKYISTDKDGNDKKEFLDDFFDNDTDMLNAIFLKGYEWPFDPRKISSLIDIAIHIETQEKGRRVWLDYRENPTNLKKDFSNLEQECKSYLENSDVLFGTPIDRLKKMNKLAIDLFKNNGIDLEKEPLEIAVSAQHNNGGLVGNIWWESNIKHFFPVGEVNGTHGIYRPGGSALNSGQCGGLRAAQYIVKNYNGINKEEVINEVANNISARIEQIENLTKNINDKEDSNSLINKIGNNMSKYAAHIRSKKDIEEVMLDANKKYENFWDNTYIKDISELPQALFSYDLLITQQVYLSSFLDYINKGGKSRGSYIIEKANTSLLEQVKKLDIERELNNKIQETEFKDGKAECTWRNTRPIPENNDWFENVYNENLK